MGTCMGKGDWRGGKGRTRMGNGEWGMRNEDVF